MLVRFTIEPALYEDAPFRPANSERLWLPGLNLTKSLPDANHKPLNEYHKPINGPHRPLSAHHRLLGAHHKPLNAHHKLLNVHHKHINAHHKNNMGKEYMIQIL